MKLEISDKIMYRVPQFPINATLYNSWLELKKSIAIASPDFFKEIEHVHFDQWDQLDLKTKHTVLKYFNRAKYRPVPYGTFAAIGLIEPQPNDNSRIVLLANEQELNKFIDWPQKTELSYAFDDVINGNCFLFANSTYYNIPGGIRYVYKNQEGFELADIDADDSIINILKHCQSPVRLSELTSKIVPSFMGYEPFLSLIENMIGEQLLITSLDPNIIGHDYFTRSGLSTDHCQGSYIIAERKYLNGNLEKRLLKHLPDLVSILQRVVKPPETPSNLKSFKEQFTKRYDQMELPLMIALDPELGIGYGKMEFADGIDEQILNLIAAKSSENLAQSPLQELIGGLLLSGVKGQTIFIDPLLQKEEQPSADFKLPNSLSAMLTVTDGLINLAHIGGISTNQLYGRFTLANDAIYQHSREIAAIEQTANPDVIFFDIGYMAELKVDNVNRRRQIYDYQLCILNYDTSEQPVTLDDLQVSVHRNEIILRSRKLNKRMVPRLASAYNHIRSDLSLFRFLCDLSQQGLQTNLSFNVESLFPGLSHYPRVQYHNIIVSPQKWQLSQQEFKKHCSKGNSSIGAYLQTVGTSRFIKIGVADQTLLLDIETTDDTGLLEAFLSRNKSFYAEEVLSPGSVVITDQTGNPFNGQFLLSMLHSGKIYEGYGLRNDRPVDIQRFFNPGSEWLYFEFFCNPQRVDHLLTGKLHHFVTTQAQLIQKWFFIRYNEGGEHVRFRLKLYNPTDAGTLMKCLSDLLHHETHYGIISNLQVKTYTREIERYGASNMEKVEDFFAEDSSFIVSLLQDEPDEHTKYLNCLSFFQHIRFSGLFIEDELLKRFLTTRTMFTKEHRIRPEGFKKLNAHIRELLKAEPPIFKKSLTDLPIYDLLLDVLTACIPENRLQLFSDLMHMHINRMFSNYQRTHELIVYELLLTIMMKERAFQDSTKKSLKL